MGALTDSCGKCVQSPCAFVVFYFVFFRICLSDFFVFTSLFVRMRTKMTRYFGKRDKKIIKAHKWKKASS